MSTADSRQRKIQQPKAVRDKGQQQAEEEEESVIKGLLPCIAGVGGVAFALWIVIYLYVPPYNGGHGLDLMCTPVKDLHELQRGLESVRKWEELGQELGVGQTVLDHVRIDSDGEQDKTKKVLRAWFEVSQESCWEEVIRSLQKIGKEALAKQLSLKYGTTRD